MRRFNLEKFKNVLLGVGCLVSAVFLLLSVVTYNQLDPSFGTVTNSTVIFNRMGAVGAYVADLAIELFGVVSFSLVPLIALAGFNLLGFGSAGHGIYSRIVALVVFILSSCTILSKLFHNKNCWGYETWGGAVGYYMNYLTLPIPGRILSVLCFSLLLASLPVLIDFSPRRLCNLVLGAVLLGVRAVYGIFGRLLVSLKKFLLKIFEITAGLAVVNRLRSKFHSWFGSRLFPRKKKYDRAREGGNRDVINIRGKEVDSVEGHTRNLEEEEICASEKTPGQQQPGLRTSPQLSAGPPGSGTKSSLLSFLHGEKRNDSSNGYRLPTPELLSSPSGKDVSLTREELGAQAVDLQRVLREYRITGRIISINAGPIITLHEFEPSAGIKSSRIIGCADDIARNLRVESTRISVIPEKNVLGIELPNKHRKIIFLKDIIEFDEYKNSHCTLPIILGSDIAGNPVIVDLAKAPHLLIAGTTGSGKSVCINTIILSLLYKFRPEECKLIMIDPKMLELSAYDGIPHLLMPVVTNSKKAIAALKWVVGEMENRYRTMSGLGVRNIYGYNEKVTQAIRNKTPLDSRMLTGYDERGEPIYTSRELEVKRLPFIVVFVDEMADLMITAGKEIEALIQRVAQMARAAGIHMVMATQRPSVDVITGVIKANFPSRISFLVSSRIDSKVILGEQGAEQLLGMGDMLYSQNGGRISRAHGPFVSDAEVEKVVNFILKQGFRPEYVKAAVEGDGQDENNDSEDEGNFDINIIGQKDDESLYQQALEIVRRENRVSISYIQRQLRIGYNKSANLVERMEKEGVVGPLNVLGKRDIIK
jgi:S-DNA-T family DNA segregation ATPase FtsK/SpoIIIE